MEKRLTMILASLFLCIGMALAQTKVSGVVTSSEDGEPVVGASVKVVGTNTGAVTDIDGRFSLQTASDAKLEISYIGMQTKTVKAAPNLKVSLDPDDQSLDEVMVVAFGTAKKSAFTGAASVVDAKDLSKKVTTNVADALVGSVAGLQMRGASGQPGSDSNGIKIRGIASMYAGTDPLIIVDGSPYPENLSTIPTDDIESVTVLKDAASAALYGARGAAGVILITTKSGKNRDAEIKFDAKWGSNSRAVQNYDVVTDPAEYYEAYYAQIANYGASLGRTGDALNSWANRVSQALLGYNVYNVPDGQQLIGTDGKINPNATLGRTYTRNGNTYYLTPDDWNKEAYHNALRQEYTLSASGSTERASFYASLGYLKDEGIIDNSDYQRYSGRIKADYQAKKWLKLGANAQFVHSDQNSSPNLDTSMGAGNIMYYTQMIGPIYPVYVRMVGADGKPYIATDEYGHKKYDYGITGQDYGPTRGFLATGNPLGANQYNKTSRGVNQFNGAVNADISFTEWLKLSLNSSVTYNTSAYTDYLNSFEGPSAGSGGRLTKSDTSYLRTNNTQTLTFMKSFGLHNVDAMLGHEYYRETNGYLASMAMAEFSPYIQEIDAYANKYDGSSYTREYNVEGYFGRVQYNYDNRYFGSVSYRRDASSRFAKENRWGNFWSVGGAWLISKEQWFNAPFVDELKLKASIGQQGNDNIGRFAYTNLYSITATSTTIPSAQIYRFGNPAISWETTTNFNAGVEFSLWKSRLTGSVDFYTKKTTDLLFWVSVPESNGARGYYDNIGDIRNTGVELVLNGAIVRTKDIDWNLSLNLSHNATKVVRLPESKKVNGGFAEANDTRIFQNWYREGGPLYNAFMPKYAGVSEDGQAQWWVDDQLDEANAGTKPGKNLSRKTTNYAEATYYEQGSMLPKVFGGLSTSFRYKNFDASVTFDFQLGGKVYDNLYRTLMDNCTSSQGSALHKDWRKSWTSTNTNTNVPRFQYGDSDANAQSDRWLTSARYLNFQSFSVGYTLPKGLIPEVSRVRIYCMGENLCFWSARKGLDPRYAFDGSGYTGVYSPTRNISGGIQVTF